MLIQSIGMTKYYGVQEIFRDLSFQIRKGERIGLVGANGEGKSTLLSCLTGQEPFDGGQLAGREGLNIGYLEQIPVWQEKRLIFEEMLESFTDLLAEKKQLGRLEGEMGNPALNADQLGKVMDKYSRLTASYEKAGGYVFENRIKRVLHGLGFRKENMTVDIRTFSGGQKTRLNLAKILVKEPDLLILDEPTNHLDLEAVEWLEDYLHDYTGAFLLVSHDRYFLDKVVEKIWELDHGKLSFYEGNYTRYLRLKEEQETAYQRAYQKEKKQIEKTEAYIEKYRAGIKSKQARGRASILARKERLLAPEQQHKLRALHFSFHVDSGNVILRFNDVEKKFADKKVLDQVDFGLYKGQKVGLIGPNGSGKSTILKMITGDVVPDQGQVEFGAQIKTAYLSQEYEGLNLQNLVLDEIRQNFPLSEREARTYLGSFLFWGDDVYKRVGDLSGGEKSRLAFLKVLLSEANVLLLDEPTNHLDIMTKNIMEQALQEYAGTILLVSHDRYFLDQVVDQILHLHEGKLTASIGNYTEYREYKERLAKEAKLNEVQVEEKKKPEKNVQQKSLQKAADLEQEIDRLEQIRSAYQLELTKPEVYRDGSKTKEILKQVQLLEEKIAQQYQIWEELL